MITHIPLDYMHFVCIGVVKKTLNLWLSGPLNIQLSTRSVNSILKSLIEIRTSIPVEFVRKLRKLRFLSLWKATELRQFFLYISPVILKNHINKDIYKKFLTLHVAIRLLLYVLQIFYISPMQNRYSNTLYNHSQSYMGHNIYLTIYMH